MPLYHYHIAARRDEAIPPVSELKTVGAVGPMEAFEQLRGKLVLGEPEQTEAWLRVVVAYHEDGSVKNTLSVSVPVIPVAANN